MFAVEADPAALDTFSSAAELGVHAAVLLTVREHKGISIPLLLPFRISRTSHRFMVHLPDSPIADGESKKATPLTLRLHELSSRKGALTLTRTPNENATHFAGTVSHLCQLAFEDAQFAIELLQLDFD
jgi:hypothetical protein